MTTKLENFIRHLIGLGMSNQDICALTNTTETLVQSVRDNKKPRREYLAPTYGAALASTPDPTTPFEIALKSAGKFATMDDLGETIEILGSLLEVAREKKDLGAELAVVSRAMQLLYRARGCRKTEQALALHSFMVEISYPPSSEVHR